MRLGTKTVLFGYHQFLLHPLFVAWAWWLLYGFPWHPMLWLSFFVHDLGYIGCREIDGPDGERHPELGARVVHWFDWYGCQCPACRGRNSHWARFVLHHSRTYARLDDLPVSKLAHSDKYAIIITPVWYQLLVMNLTGEIHEYMGDKVAAQAAYRTPGAGMSQREFVAEMRHDVRKWMAKEGVKVP